LNEYFYRDYIDFDAAVQEPVFSYNFSEPPKLSERTSKEEVKEEDQEDFKYDEYALFYYSEIS